MTGRWLVDARMAESTRAMRKGVVDRNILPVLKNRLFTEISADDLRALYNKVTVRGAPATAVHVRDIVKQVYAFAILYGEKVENPVDGVGAASIAIVVPKDRSLSPMEIRLTCGQMESVATYPTIRLALRMVLLTLVRKNELIEATWAEIDFETAIWMIPKQRMKGRNPHVIYGRGAGRLQVRLSRCCLGYLQNADRAGCGFPRGCARKTRSGVEFEENLRLRAEYLLHRFVHGIRFPDIETDICRFVGDFPDLSNVGALQLLAAVFDRPVFYTPFHQGGS